MDPLKEAFSKIKEEITFLRNDVSLLRKALLELYDHTLQEKKGLPSPTMSSLYPTRTPTSSDNQTTQQTDRQENATYKGLKGQNIGISTGNKGVPTDKQTDEYMDRQTNRQEDSPTLDPLFHVGEVLESLDTIKKELRLKFKRLTPQEMAVFEQIYLLDSQNHPEITYKLLSQQLQLSESSIREYSNKLTKKGIPLEKIRVNNKTIVIKIPLDLKKIASLDTIIRLREL